MECGEEYRQSVYDFDELIENEKKEEENNGL